MGTFRLPGGGRTGYVAVNWAYFRSQPQEIYQVQLGGLSWAGAVLGGLIALFAVAGARKTLPGELADALLPLGTALAVSAWLGCWLDGCAYGAQNNAWWALPALDEWGMFAQRLPLQLLGVGSMLGLQAAIDWIRPRLKANGAAAAVWFVVFSFYMLIFSFLRADPAPSWQEIRLDTWAAGFYLVIASFFIGMYSLRPIYVKNQNPL